jgi:hypothetical protein
MERTISAARNSSDGRRGAGLLAPVAAVGWLSLAALDLAVRVALFRVHRTEAATSLLWGLGFALFLWFGSLVLGLDEPRAIAFGVIAGGAIALFVYLRGAALDGAPIGRPRLPFVGHPAPVEQPAVPRSHGRSPARARDLFRARIALADGDPEAALYWLREAERVAVAQRKLDELLEVRELLGAVTGQAHDRTEAAAVQFAGVVAEDLRTFPAEELAAAGVPPEPDPVALLVARRQAAAAGDGRKTRDLVRARAALDRNEPETALHELYEARRVAVAQRKLDELLEVHELVVRLSDASTGRTHALARQLALDVDRDLRAFV